MVPGYNHNILYKGVSFHIQTEDSGAGKPLITTLLYRDGTIIASKKTDYSDILKVEMLERVVEDLMKEQHKEILRRLKSGEFDNRAFPSGAPVDAAPEDTECASIPSRDESDKPKKQVLSLDEMILEYLLPNKD